MFDKCIYISKIDQEFMVDEKTIDKTTVIPNGVDTEFFKNITNKHNPYEIVYVGSMSSAGNHDAVKYFIKSIYPLIKQKIPSVTFKIIGANPRKELVDIVSQDTSITLTGKVADVRLYLASASVAIAPMRIVSGLQNKILETMSMGIPTVTTKAGAEGITFDENILLIAENNDDFADKVCILLNDENLRKKYSQISRKFCIENFSWDKYTRILEKTFYNIIESKK